MIEEWSELDGIRCQVDDLSVRHRSGDILEPEPAELRDEDYLEQSESDVRAGGEHWLPVAPQPRAEGRPAAIAVDRLSASDKDGILEIRIPAPELESAPANKIAISKT